jgi:septation ring formation regulator EzrA
MQDKINDIITEYSEKMREVDKTKSIPMIVKDLDHIVYDMYRQLYGLRDIRADNYCLNTFTADNKKGHCS